MRQERCFKSLLASTHAEEVFSGGESPRSSWVNKARLSRVVRQAVRQLASGTAGDFPVNSSVVPLTDRMDRAAAFLPRAAGELGNAGDFPLAQCSAPELRLLDPPVLLYGFEASVSPPFSLSYFSIWAFYGRMLRKVLLPPK